MNRPAIQQVGEGGNNNDNNLKGDEKKGKTSARALHTVLPAISSLVVKKVVVVVAN